MNLMKYVLIFFFGFSLGAFATEDLEFITLSTGLQQDYQLPNRYKGKKLKLEGTYRQFTSAVHRKAKNDLRFFPKQKGTGTLIIKNSQNKILKKINVDVYDTSLHKVAKEVKDLLITVDGIDVKILNDKVVIDGEILLPRELDRIQIVVKEYEPRVVSLVTFSPKAQNHIASLIEKEIGLHGAPDEVTVRAAYNRFILEGEVSTQEQKDRARIIAELYTQFDAEGAGLKTGAVRRKNFLSVTNLIKLRQKPPPPQAESIKKLVQVVVHYVELAKSYNKGFIFQWAPGIADNTNVTVSAGSGNVQGVGLTGLLTSTINNFFPKLNWAKSFNFARVLHNSSLMLEEGSPGTITVATKLVQNDLNARGEVTPSPVSARVSTTVTPTIIGLRKDTVHLVTGFTVSNPTGNQQRTDKSINTTIHVRSGRSAVLGGLISSYLTKDYNRLPASETASPPIINLFSSKDYDTSKSQFVVFITPLIKGSASTGVERIKRKFKLEE